MKTMLYVTNSASSNIHDTKFLNEFINKENKEYKIILVNTYLLGEDKGTNLLNQLEQRKRDSVVELSVNKKNLVNIFLNHQLEFKLISCLGTIDNIIPKIIHKYSVDYIVSVKNNQKNSEKLIRRINNESDSSEISYQFRNL